MRVVLLMTTLLLGSALAEITLATEPSALVYTGHHLLRQTDPNLTGQETLIGTICRSLTYINGNPQDDYRFNMNHECLADADVVFMDGTDGGFGLSDHATSIAGILLGMDPQATYSDLDTFRYQGVCPDAWINAYEFTDFSTRKLLAGEPISEDVLVLSLGHMFEFWWVRALERAAAEQDILVVASNGNGRDTNTPNPLYPAAGSNVLAVGVIDSAFASKGNLSLSDFSTPKPIYSSIGPTEDNRCKPDMVAPGTALVPSSDDNQTYIIRANWSSLSAPVVAGTAALLNQKGMSDPVLSKLYNKAGKSLVLKAILMNSARKLPYWHKGLIGRNDDHEKPLDYAQGAGALDAMAAYNQLIAGAQKPGLVRNSGWDNRILQTGDWGYEYSFNAADPNQKITVTLCWNRVYQDQYPFDHLLDNDTDLRLELWGIDPNSPDSDILLDYSDSINDNVEHIYFTSNALYASYAIRVRFNPDQQDYPPLKQRFAVAWSVEPNRQIDNKWWFDLNEDNLINSTDNVIYSLLDSGLINRPDMSPLLKSLNLSDERLELLTEGWPEWKPYLSDWKE